MRITQRPTAWAVTLASATALASGVLIAQPAAADLVTSCVGTGGAVTVPGDLVVPAGRSCSLDGTTVQGDVVVRADADLLAEGAVFQGDVRVVDGGYLDLIDTSVAGAVIARDSFGVAAADSSVAGDVRLTTSAGGTPFLTADGLAVGGAVRSSSGGGLELYSSEVTGPVVSRGSDFTDVVDSVLEGSLTVSGAVRGTITCTSEVYGAAVFDANAGLSLGGAPAGDVDCSGSNYWAGSVRVDNGTVRTEVSGNIVRGDLSGSNNTPAPTGEGNRVRGTVSGQFAELGTGQAARRPAAIDPQDVRGRLHTAVEDRRLAATTEATTAGDAGL